MNYKQATDEITSGYTMRDVARETGMSEATARRARLDPSSPAYRKPPEKWREAIVRLAEDRIAKLRELVEELRK